MEEDGAVTDHRRPRAGWGGAVVQRARDLGAYLQAQGSERGDAAGSRDADAVLRDTAIDLQPVTTLPQPVLGLR